MTIEHIMKIIWKNDLMRISFDVYERPQEIRYNAAALWIYEHFINKWVSSLSTGTI